MATRPLSGDRIPVTTLPAPQDAAERVFAILGRDGAGDLIEALLERMDAADGDTDREGVFGEGLCDDDEPDDQDDDTNNDLEAIDEREPAGLIIGGGSDGWRQ